jgi:DNA helicase-2/ATP-dependent DNA helicase PcrA
VQTSAPFEADDCATIQEGMEVEHQKFGTGKVVRLEGVYPDSRATVHFPAHGNKQLLLKFAKLRILK